MTDLPDDMLYNDQFHICYLKSIMISCASIDFKIRHHFRHNSTFMEIVKDILSNDCLRRVCTVYRKTWIGPAEMNGSNRDKSVMSSSFSTT